MSGWKSGACENINSHKECTNDSDCDGGICIENECHATECIASECENIYELENGRCISRTTCPPNQHQYKNFCEDDDTDNCGDHNNQCRIAVEGWETGKCEAGRCVVERCKPGYHLSEGRCKDDTPLACGEPPTACAPGQLCSNGTCKDNCDSGYIRCVSLEDIVSCADPLTNSTYCGADSSCTSYISCQTGQTCKEGSCIQTSCPEDGKTLCEIEGQPQCIAIHADDAANCGDCNYNCNEHTPENAVSLGCFEGQCRYECASGYTNCGTSDMMRCLSISSFAADSHNCGGCDIKCDPNDEYCKDNHCLKSTCNNSCLNDGECINTDTKCGTGCLNCNTANDAASGICDNGTCKIQSCRENFHLNNGACVANTETACAPVNDDATVNCLTHDNATSGYCKSGQCVATACKPDYHIKNGTCVADTVDACGANEVSCTTLTGWAQGSCQNGACTATQCKSGFCLNGTQCVDGTSSMSTCGTDGQACKSCGNHESCQNGTCKLSSCENNICFYQQQSCSNTSEHCGNDCTNCNTAGNAASGTCNNGVCIITSCKSGYHIYNNTCELDTITNCGSHGYTCSEKIPAWSSGTCTDKTCKANACTGNYHLYNNTCEEDSLNHCGSHNNKCSNISGWAGGTCTNHQCKATSCASNYHIYSYACELDSSTNCGSHGNKCQNGETCQNKTCKCPGGYTTVNGGKAACISSVEDFLSFRNAINSGKTWPSDNTNKSYALTRSISLGTQNNWIGVGTSSNPFIGNFYGLSNATISGSLNCSSDKCGIFGYAAGKDTSSTNILGIRSTVTVNSSSNYVGGIIGHATYTNLHNLTSTGVINGKSYVGGIVGYFAPGEIDTCSSSSSVTASDQSAGGIVGEVQGTNITHCNTSGAVTANGSQAGGIAGKSSNGVSITNSYSTGTITGFQAGGISGFASEGSITNCYSTGLVGSDSASGGIAGSTSRVTIKSSYHDGTVDGSGSNGGLVGRAYSETTIYNSGAFGIVSGSTSGGLIGTVDKEAKTLKLQNNITAVDLTGTTTGGMIGSSNAPADGASILDCNWIGAVFKGQSNAKGAVLNGEKTFKQNGPNFVYEATYSSATNREYANISPLSNHTLMWEGSHILNVLKNECSSKWTAQSCTLSNGLAGPATYTLSIPPDLSPANCH
ncbi:MAG: hypothetical protein IJ165_07990 [Proteobacteria bacterium]|nr:hypothetical protein [Pseudomonadota bacterium]